MPLNCAVINFRHLLNLNIMQNFLTATPGERQAHMNMATLRSGIPHNLLEHDWWQSFVLQNLFELPFASFLTLNGSRSLCDQ